MTQPYAINPADVLFFRDSGVGDMARTFKLTGAHAGMRPLLVFARCHFVNVAAAGTSVMADMTISVDAEPDSEFDTPYGCELLIIEDAGLGFDVNWKLPVFEESRWVLQQGAGYHFAWTNPDADDIGWGLEVGIFPVGAGSAPGRAV